MKCPCDGWDSEKVRAEAKQISKHVMAVANKLNVRPDTLHNAIRRELDATCFTEQVKRHNLEAHSIDTKEKAAEWAAREWLAAEKRSEDDCFGEDLWGKDSPPTAKDFLDNPELFEDFVKPMLDFDADSEEEKAYYRLIVKVLDVGLGK